MNAKKLVTRTGIALAMVLTIVGCADGTKGPSESPASPTSSVTSSPDATQQGTGLIVAFNDSSAAAKSATDAGAEDNVLDALSAEQSSAVTEAVAKYRAKVVSSHPRSGGAMLVLLDTSLPEAEAAKLAADLNEVPDVKYVEVEGKAQIN